MKRKTALLVPAALLAARVALAEEGVRVPGSKLPYLAGGVVAIAIGIFLFAGMLAGRQKREVMVTPTGLPIPVPLIPLILGIVIGIAAFKATPNDSFVRDGVRYSLGETSAAAVGFVKDAEVPETLKLPEKVDGVPLTSVGGFAGSEIREVELPSTVKEIGKNAFKGCASLKAVRITGKRSDPITFWQSAFANCASLQTLEGFDLVKRVGAFSFQNCTSLVTVQMTAVDSGNYPHIEQESFRGCSSLQSVALSGVWTIESEAFKDCPNLESLDLEDSHGISRIAFKGSPNVVVYTDSTWATGEAQRAGVKTAPAR